MSSNSALELKSALSQLNRERSEMVKDLEKAQKDYVAARNMHKSTGSQNHLEVVNTCWKNVQAAQKAHQSKVEEFHMVRRSFADAVRESPESCSIKNRESNPSSTNDQDLAAKKAVLDAEFREEAIRDGVFIPTQRYNSTLPPPLVRNEYVAEPKKSTADEDFEKRMVELQRQASKYAKIGDSAVLKDRSTGLTAATIQLFAEYFPKRRELSNARKDFMTVLNLHASTGFLKYCEAVNASRKHLEAVEEAYRKTTNELCKDLNEYPMESDKDVKERASKYAEICRLKESEDQLLDLLKPASSELIPLFNEIVNLSGIRTKKTPTQTTEASQIAPESISTSNVDPATQLDPETTQTSPLTSAPVSWFNSESSDINQDITSYPDLVHHPGVDSEKQMVEFHRQALRLYELQTSQTLASCFDSESQEVNSLLNNAFVEASEITEENISTTNVESTSQSEPTEVTPETTQESAPTSAPVVWSEAPGYGARQECNPRMCTNRQHSSPIRIRHCTSRNVTTYSVYCWKRPSHVYTYNHQEEKFEQHKCLACVPRVQENHLFPTCAVWNEKISNFVIFMDNMVTKQKDEQYMFSFKTGGFEQVNYPEVQPAQGPKNTDFVAAVNGDGDDQVIIQKSRFGVKKLEFRYGKYVKIPSVEVRTLLMKELEGVEMVQEPSSTLPLSTIRWCPTYSQSALYIFSSRLGHYLKYAFNPSTQQFEQLNCSGCPLNVEEWHLCPLYAEYADSIKTYVIHVFNDFTKEIEKYMYCVTGKCFYQVTCPEIVYDSSKAHSSTVLFTVSAPNHPFTIFMKDVNGRIKKEQLNGLHNGYMELPSAKVYTLYAMRCNNSAGTTGI